VLCQQQHEAGQKEPKVAHPNSPLLIGDVKEGDVREINEPSYIDSQTKLLYLLTYNVTILIFKNLVTYNAIISYYKINSYISL
jgi:hypothetical protein